MSILPLGETSADRPGLDYQKHLNTPRLLPQLVREALAHPDLAATGWFSQCWGPAGICPVQLMGLLHNGEFVYFRARGTKLELSIAAEIDGSMPHARYLQNISLPNSQLGAGELPESFCVSFIKRHLQDYLARCEMGHKRYDSAPYSVQDSDEVVAL